MERLRDINGIIVPFIRRIARGYFLEIGFHFLLTLGFDFTGFGFSGVVIIFEKIFSRLYFTISEATHSLS